MPDHERRALREFIDELARLREDAGNPSLPALQRLSEQAYMSGKKGFRVLARSTTHEILAHRRTRWPEWEWVASFVSACLDFAHNTPGVDAGRLGDLQHWRGRFIAARGSRKPFTASADEGVRPRQVAGDRAAPWATGAVAEQPEQSGDWAVAAPWATGAVAEQPEQPGEPSPTQSTFGPRGGPKVVRMMLGTRLHKLREERRITREDAGRVIQAPPVRISQLERGQVEFGEAEVAELLTLYGITDDAQKAALLSLVHQANTPAWWHSYGALPDWFETYLGLEEAASRIRTYAVQFVPDLLQTADYARAVIGLGHPDATDEEIDQQVGLRMRRQQLLTRPEPLLLWAVVDEMALRRMIGGAHVVRTQLRRLIEIATLPNVTLNVFPLHVESYAAPTGPFSILRFTEPELTDLVYMEQLTGAIYLDSRHDLDRYALVMEQLCTHAERDEATVRTLEMLLTDI